MGRGIIDVPVREVAEFIKDVQNNMTWDDLLIVSTILTHKTFVSMRAVNHTRHVKHCHYRFHSYRRKRDT